MQYCQKSNVGVLVRELSKKDLAFICQVFHFQCGPTWNIICVDSQCVNH